MLIPEQIKTVVRILKILVNLTNSSNDKDRKALLPPILWLTVLVILSIWLLPQIGNILDILIRQPGDIYPREALLGLIFLLFYVVVIFFFLKSFFTLIKQLDRVSENPAIIPPSTRPPFSLHTASMYIIPTHENALVDLSELIGEATLEFSIPLSRCPNVGAFYYNVAGYMGRIKKSWQLIHPNGDIMMTSVNKERAFQDEQDLKSAGIYPGIKLKVLPITDQDKQRFAKR